MTDVDHTDHALDVQLTDAFRAFDRVEVGDAPGLDGSMPPRRRTERVLGVAAAVIVVAGVAAVALVSRESTDGPDAASVAEPGTEAESSRGAPGPTGPAAPTMPGTVEPDHWCRGLIGQRGDERIYDDCTPEIEFGIVDFVCTGLITVDADGRDGLEACRPTAPDSAVPGIDSLPDPGPVTLEVAPAAPPFEVTTYVIQPGDFPIDVADRFCMTVDQLARYNDDRGTFSAFLVGSELTVRNHSPDDECQLSPELTYVVQEGDWPLRVADLHCVSLVDLISYNGWASDAEFPFPGAEILVPPGSCPPSE